MGRRSFRPDRVLCWGLSILLMGIVLLPVAAVTVSALSEGTGPEALGYLLRHYGSWLLFSLELAFLALAVSLVAGIPAAYVLVRHPFPGSRILEDLLLLPLSLPGIALSIALVSTYGSLRGPWLVLGGHVLYTLPFMVRSVTGALRASNLGPIEQAARSLGAGFWHRAWLIVFPSLRHSILVGSLVVLAVSWGEFNVSYLLNRGEPQTFPAALYNTFANETLARSSAAMLLFLAVALPLGVMVQWVGESESGLGDEAS